MDGNEMTNDQPVPDDVESLTLEQVWRSRPLPPLPFAYVDGELEGIAKDERVDRYIEKLKRGSS